MFVWSMNLVSTPEYPRIKRWTPLDILDDFDAFDLTPWISFIVYDYSPWISSPEMPKTLDIQSPENPLDTQISSSGRFRDYIFGKAHLRWVELMEGKGKIYLLVLSGL